MSTVSTVAGYDRFAEIYSQFMASEFCRRTWPAIERIFLSRLALGAHVLDLCCGSGQMAQALSQQGFRVTGLDASERMLHLARQNAPGAAFKCGDARDFTFASSFDGVLSTFNSLAHVESAADLAWVFRNVRAALAAGGPFVFDLSMEEAYSSKWRGMYELVTDEYACIVRPSYDSTQRLGRNEVTLIRRRDGAGAHGATSNWTRSDFCIEQRCYGEEEVRAALSAAGFDSVRSLDAHRDLDVAGEWGRRFFVCA